jgi:hypothetical protein
VKGTATRITIRWNFPNKIEIAKWRRRAHDSVHTWRRLCLDREVVNLSWPPPSPRPQRLPTSLPLPRCFSCTSPPCFPPRTGSSTLPCRHLYRHRRGGVAGDPPRWEPARLGLCRCGEAAAAARACQFPQLPSPAGGPPGANCRARGRRRP